MSPCWSSLPLGARILRAHTLFWWALVFPIVVLVIVYAQVTSYSKARAILADHSISEARVSIDAEAKPSRQLARFKYSYEVDGKTYTGTFSTPKSRADNMGDTLPIAYANFDPALSQRPDLLASNADLGDGIRTVATLSALGTVLIGFFYLCLTILIRFQIPKLPQR